MLGSMDAKVGKKVKNKLAQLPRLEGCNWDMEQKILLVELAAKEPLASELHSAGAHIRVLLFLLFHFCISYFRERLNAHLHRQDKADCSMALKGIKRNSGKYHHRQIRNSSKTKATSARRGSFFLLVVFSLCICLRQSGISSLGYSAVIYC